MEGNKKTEGKSYHKLATLKGLMIYEAPSLPQRNVAGNQQLVNVQAFLLPGHTHSGKYSEMTDATDFSMGLRSKPSPTLCEPKLPRLIVFYIGSLVPQNLRSALASS